MNFSPPSKLNSFFDIESSDLPHLILSTDMPLVYSNIDEKQLSKQNRLFDVLGHGKLEHIVCDFTALVRLLASERLWNAFCTLQQKTGLRVECVKGNAIDLATNGLLGDVGADNVVLNQSKVCHDLKQNYVTARVSGMIVENEYHERHIGGQWGTACQKKKYRLNDYRTTAWSLATNSQAVFLTDSYNDNGFTRLNTSPSGKICSTPLLLILFLRKGLIDFNDLPTIIEFLFPLAGDGDKSYNNKNKLPNIALRYFTAVCVYRRREKLCDGNLCQHNTSPCPWMTSGLWNRFLTDWRAERI